MRSARSYNHVLDVCWSKCICCYLLVLLPGHRGQFQSSGALGTLTLPARTYLQLPSTATNLSTNILSTSNLSTNILSKTNFPTNILSAAILSTIFFQQQICQQIFCQQQNVINMQIVDSNKEFPFEQKISLLYEH